MHKLTEAMIEKAMKDKIALSKKYNVPVSSIVWMGDLSYILVKDGEQIRIGWGDKI